MLFGGCWDELDSPIPVASEYDSEEDDETPPGDGN